MKKQVKPQTGEERAKMLGEKPILPLIVQLSSPAIVGMVVSALYSVVDRIFVGKGVANGDEALAAIALCMPVIFVQMAFGMLAGIGTGNMVSIRLGQDENEQAKKILNTGFLLTIVIGVIFSVVGLIFIHPLLIFLKANPGTAQYEFALSYLRIILFGSVFQMIAMAMNNPIRATGEATTAMLTMLVGAILNTLLDPLFIFVFGWGVAGAAIATVISQFVSALWVIYHLSAKKSIIRLKPSLFKFDVKYIKQIFSIGVSPFALQLAASFVTFLFNAQCKEYGLLHFGEGGDTIALSSFIATNSVAMFILMPIFGLNQGMQPIIGYNYGAKKYQRVIQTYITGAIFASVVSSAGFVLVMFFSPQLTMLFTGGESKQLMEYSPHVMRIMLCCLPIVGFQIVSSAYFTSAGKAMSAAFITLSRQLIFLVPFVYVLPLFFKLEGLLLATPAADLLATLVTAAMAFREIRIMKRLSP